MQGPSFAIALQLRILSLTETVEICLCRLPLQVAKYHESADGDVAVVRAASQSFLHCLGVVHLAIVLILKQMLAQSVMCLMASAYSGVAISTSAPERSLSKISIPL